MLINQFGITDITEFDRKERKHIAILHTVKEDLELQRGLNGLRKSRYEELKAIEWVLTLLDDISHD